MYKRQVEDGYLHAAMTTLGADDGYGVCYMLAILTDKALKHLSLIHILLYYHLVYISAIRF